MPKLTTGPRCGTAPYPRTKRSPHARTGGPARASNSSNPGAADSPCQRSNLLGQNSWIAAQ
ncbi:hypothetical protein BGW80DRAFT_1408492, partial [Lactifluus volemus]